MIINDTFSFSFKRNKVQFNQLISIKRKLGTIILFISKKKLLFKNDTIPVCN